MFRENKEHLQQSFVTSHLYMNQSVYKKLLNSWASVFYNVIFCGINERIFSILYCNDNGRPNFPVNILLSLEYIKHLFNYTDVELVEQFYFNYQIGYALGIKNVGETNLAPSTLYEFRRKLYEYVVKNPKEGDLIFSQFIQLTKDFIKKSDIEVSEQRMDSTMISANIKNAGRLALAYDVLVQGVKSLPKELLTDGLKEVIEDGYKNKLLYKCKNNQIISKLQEILDKCIEVNDIAKKLPDICGQQEIEVLIRFIEEQTVLDAATNKRNIKENKDIKANSMQSAYDLDATYRKKAKKTDQGYSVNIAETCGRENTVQFITDYDVKPNVISDVEFGIERLPEIKANFADTKEMYLDGGYYSGKLDSVGEENEINMNYTDMTGKKPDEGAVLINEFKFSDENHVTMCPTGNVPLTTSYDAINDMITANFSKESCADCELFEKCCIIKQVRTNKLSTSVNAIEIQNKRDKIKFNIKENGSKRTAIEGTNSELKRGHGLNNVLVRGIEKLRITTGLKITVCNFKRFAKNALNKMLNNSILPESILDNGIVLPI